MFTFLISFRHCFGSVCVLPSRAINDQNRQRQKSIRHRAQNNNEKAFSSQFSIKTTIYESTSRTRREKNQLTHLIPSYVQAIRLTLPAIQPQLMMIIIIITKRFVDDALQFEQH